MPYLPEMHYCCVCNEYLGPDNGDGICPVCDEKDEDYNEQQELNQDEAL